jgi:uncharacterized protein YkwD
VPAIEVEPAAARVAPMSRGLVRELGTFGDLNLVVSLSPIPETTDSVLAEAAPEAVPEPIVEATLQPEPEATPEPQPEPEPAPAPESTPELTPRPTPRSVVPIALTTPTMLWAEGRMLELMNASRARAGLAPLVPDVGVANTARAHSAAEAQVRYVYHDGPDGTARSRNVPACGTGWYGENTGKIWNDNVDALHIEFMNEPWEPINHRTNIMDPAFLRVGVGAVMGPDAMYMTMVFCR